MLFFIQPLRSLTSLCFVFICSCISSRTSSITRDDLYLDFIPYSQPPYGDGQQLCCKPNVCTQVVTVTQDSRPHLSLFVKSQPGQQYGNMWHANFTEGMLTRSDEKLMPPPAETWNYFQPCREGLRPQG